MYLTIKQIESFIQKVDQPKASVILNRFFNSYRKKLTSSNVKDLYDHQYRKRINSHEVSLLVAGKYKLNIYNRFAYDYLVPKLLKNVRVLDVGCGDGEFSLAVAAHNVKIVAGIDFSPESIADATAKSKGSHFNNCSFMCADVSALANDHVFDFIVLNDIIEHLSDGELISLFQKITTMLSRDGEIIIHTPNGLALGNDTDTNYVQILFKVCARLLKGWKGHPRTVEQLFYDQMHINIKSYSQFRKFIKKFKLKTNVYYDERSRLPLLSQLSSNMLIVAKKKRI